MAINVFKKGRTYSKTVFFKEQALRKAALAAGLDVRLSLRNAQIGITVLLVGMQGTVSRLSWAGWHGAYTDLCKGHATASQP